MGGEQLNIAVQRIGPSAFVFFDSNYSGKYDKPFYVEKETLALGVPSSR